MHVSSTRQSIDKVNFTSGNISLLKLNEWEQSHYHAIHLPLPISVTHNSEHGNPRFQLIPNETRVSKHFPGYGCFKGVYVGRSEQGKYRVEYKDGDAEDLCFEEIQKIVVVKFRPSQRQTGNTTPAIPALGPIQPHSLLSPIHLQELVITDLALGDAESSLKVVAENVQTPSTSPQLCLTGAIPVSVPRNSDRRNLVQVFTSHPLLPLGQAKKPCIFGKNCLTRMWNNQLIAQGFKKAPKGGAQVRPPRTAYFCKTCDTPICELDYWAHHSLKGICLLDEKVTIKIPV